MRHVSLIVYKVLPFVWGLICAVGMAGMAMAGSMESPGAPGSAESEMPALGDIYTYLTTGTPVPAPGSIIEGPSSGPTAGTGRTLTEIYGAVATPFPMCDATAADVQSGKKFFCTVAGSWGVNTGTMPVGLLKTGQTSVYQTNDDGTYQKIMGRDFSYSWDVGRETVKDNNTGLIWPSDGFGPGCKNGYTLDWTGAIDWAEALTFAGYSDWRLPNVNELHTLQLLDASHGIPYINTTYFSVQLGGYWSSTTLPESTAYAFYDTNYHGSSDFSLKSCEETLSDHCLNYVRAVRGGGDF